MKKQHKVVMLPTKKASLLNLENGKLQKSINPVGNGYCGTYMPQFLYIVSDEEIKEGDWCIDMDCKLFQHQNIWPISIGQRKIIVTTDPELVINIKQEGHTDGTNFHLPKIPQDFIETYIKRYNAGNPIKTVMVEYNDITEEKKRLPLSLGGSIGVYDVRYKLKINPDNTIIIHTIEKKMYTREEVLEIAKKAAKHGLSCRNDGFDDEFDTDTVEDYFEIKDWLNKNYPE